MSFSNIQDYMSFFFVGKYINNQGISVRNIAPSLDNKKDIYSKTAKLVNLAINHNLTPKNSLNYRNPENPDLERTTNDFLNEFQVKIGFKPAKRNQVGTRGRNQNHITLADYCSFLSNGLISAKPLAKLRDDFVTINNPDAKKFYGSLIAGSYIGNETLLGTVYNNYYSSHMFNFFSKLAAPTQFEHHKLMIFNSEQDVHRYLRDFYGFVQSYEMPTDTIADGNMVAAFSRDQRYANFDLNNFTNTEFWLPLSNVQVDRWTNQNVILLLDHMDLTSYYNVANGLVLSKLHQTFRENNYVIPPSHVADISNFNYSVRTNSNAHVRSDKFRSIPRRYLQNGQAPTPFVYVVKIAMPRNESAYVLMTNIEDPFDATFESNINLRFSFNHDAFISSANFKTTAEAVKNYIDTYFKTVNNEQ